jgi:hypothetical protein
MFNKTRDILRAQGVSGLTRRGIAFVYRRGVRPCIPFGRTIHYAGIPIWYDTKWSDRLVPKSWILDEAFGDKPHYEATLVAALSETVRFGDSVVIIGGGLGVTTVISALRVGPSGTVQCFEGSKQHVKLVQKTAARNSATNITVHHAVVAKSIAVYGNKSDGGMLLPPSKLPPCNVLELDCEGAEVEILRELTIQPRVIVVETHGLYGAPTDLIASLLERRGYTVSDRGVAVPLRGDYCKRHDIRVLLGKAA